MDETRANIAVMPDPAQRLECPNCGYDVRGRDSQRCPECGLALDPRELHGPHLPWTRRRSTGRVRAFLRTVHLVLFRQRELNAQIDKPVRYADAQRFREMLILLLYVPLLLGSLAVVALGEGASLDFLEFDAPAGAIATNVVLHGSVLLFLFAITGVPSYFFHPKYLPVERQNRAVALSYYTAAPLALLLPAYVLVPVGLRVGGLGFQLIGLILVVAGVLCALAAPFWWLVALRRLGNHILGPARAWKTTFLVLPLWILLAITTLSVVPLTVYYVAIIVASLRI